MRRHQVPLLNYLRRHLSLQDAEDVLQDAFIRAYTAIDRYHSQYSFASWLVTIARRLSINHARRRQPVPASNLLEGHADTLPAPSEIVDEQEQQGRLWELARRTLNERSLSSLWLFYGEGMSIKEICQALESTPGSVKSTLSRARTKLQKALESEQRRKTHLSLSSAASESLPAGSLDT